MFITFLRRLAAVILILSGIRVSAQQDHFVYLQTENQQPFYVKLANKIFSSSSTGYLILPKLTDKDYDIIVGFPKNEFPEQDFKIDINNSDEGFLIKNFGDKGLGLFNLQSLDITMSANVAATQTADTTAKVYNNDAFSKMLAGVVKDSTLLQKEQPKPAEEVKKEKTDSSLVMQPDTNPLVKSADTSIEVKQNNDTSAIISSNTANINSKPGSSIVSSTVSKNYFVPVKKILNDKNDDGEVMIYVDTFSKAHDTIMVFIPAEKRITATENKDTSNKMISEEVKQNPVVVLPDSSSIKPVTKDTGTLRGTTSYSSPLVAANENQKTTQDTIYSSAKANLQLQNTQSTNEVVQRDSTVNQSAKADEHKTEKLPLVVTSTSTNSDCKAFATNEDFLKLRKRMASENSDEDMIKVAKKYFKLKCFSTEQVKNLSFLFLTNQGKYEFFDAAYAFVSDSQQYYILQSQFTDTYYLNRFKAMIQR